MILGGAVGAFIGSAVALLGGQLTAIRPLGADFPRRCSGRCATHSWFGALEGGQARQRPRAKPWAQMLPVEYLYGGPVGSEGRGPNSPSGALFPLLLGSAHRLSLHASPDAADLSMAAITSWRRTASAKSGTAGTPTRSRRVVATRMRRSIPRTAAAT